MGYDPFQRGAHPVGVRTISVESESGRDLPTEVWYPATDQFAGKDLAKATQDSFEMMPGIEGRQAAVREATPVGGAAPVVLFAHGHGSHRRSCNFLCTHLASHGYVVAAPDFVGNTILDFMKILMSRDKTDLGAYMKEVIDHRPKDIAAVKAAVSMGAPAVGLLGHSLGGWTVLAAAKELQPGAVMTMCSSGGPDSRVGSLLLDSTDFDWENEIPTLFVASGRDAIVPLASTEELFGRVAAPKEMVVLRNAGHFHVGDGPEQAHEWFRALNTSGFLPHEPMVPFRELCPGAHGHELVRSAALVHFDQHLRSHERAPEFRANLVGTLRGRGLDLYVHT